MCPCRHWVPKPVGHLEQQDSCFIPILLSFFWGFLDFSRNDDDDEAANVKCPFKHKLKKNK